MRIGLSLVWLLCCPVLAMDDANLAAPSADLLEFLGEMEPLDEETWYLLEQNARKDVAEKKEVNRE